MIYMTDFPSWGAFWDSVDPGYEDDLTFLRFTGFRDKNGKEIWEGDVVRYKDRYVSGHRNAVVVFDKAGWRLDGQLLSEWELMPQDDFEVLGNVYEHPAL